jgi:hypothetical protein
MDKKFLRAYARKMAERAGRRRPFTLREAEAEVLATMRKVCRSLRYAYRFAGQEAADIEQEGYYAAIQVLNSGKYDVARPLENFLRGHLKKRLSNFRRNHSVRIEAPCSCCDLRNPASPCRRWLDWSERNTRKQNILQPIDLDSVADEHESGMRTEATAHEDAAACELANMIDCMLPVELRADYLRLLSGQVVPKNRRRAVQQAVRELLLDGGYLDGDEEDWLARQSY